MTRSDNERLLFDKKKKKDMCRVVIETGEEEEEKQAIFNIYGLHVYVKRG
jgi:hypothetical protein